MRFFFLLIFCLLFAATSSAAQLCQLGLIPASTPTSQFVDNNDGTVTDLKTGLMWRKCIAGVYGNLCDKGSPARFTWQQALQRPGAVNDAGGFAGHTDWRLPNIKELVSLIEEQCVHPAINLNRFPFPDTGTVWSGSPYIFNLATAWAVNFSNGGSNTTNRQGSFAVWLVRGGQ
ncbi:MAG: DUF1566 domain-containing protein [Candidatus Electrothrix sp. AR5]|nr:DUF1566 domain-containing protein [Candidatus Electrothrix sp. AR5]